MAIDIAGLLSVYGDSLFNTRSSNQTNTSNSADFTNYFMNALSNPGNPSSVTGDSLSTAVSSTSANLAQTLLSGGSSSGFLTDYTNNTTSGMNSIFSSTMEPASSQEMLGTSAVSDYFSDMLTSSLQSQITSMLTNSRTNLENNMNGYTTKVGDDSSTGVQQTIERMQSNISSLDNFLSERKTENSLLDALNAKGSLTQYLINKNNTSTL